jgi:hypothetical protein
MYIRMGQTYTKLVEEKARIEQRLFEIKRMLNLELSKGFNINTEMAQHYRESILLYECAIVDVNIKLEESKKNSMSIPFRQCTPIV